RIVVSGARGRMGRAVAALAAAAEDIDLIGGIGREAGVLPGAYERVVPPEQAAGIVAECDVVVDFSAPEFLARVLDSAPLDGRALVVGTTGLDDALRRRLDAL